MDFRINSEHLGNSEISAVCVIPARSGSKGLPDKNIRNLGKMPLLAYPIQTALKSRYVDRVLCSTDSEHYANIAQSFGAEVPFLRSSSLSGDEVNSVDVVLDLINKCGLEDYDYVIMLEPTSPFTSYKDVDAGLELLASNPIATSIISISESVSGHPHFTFKLSSESFIHPFENKEWRFLRRQELSELYFQDGSFYASKLHELIDKRSFVTNNTLGYPLPKWKSFEIDDELDFKIAEVIHKLYLEEKIL